MTVGQPARLISHRLHSPKSGIYCYMKLNRNDSGLAAEKLKSTQSQWLIQTYQIKQHAEGNILTEEVRGQVRAGLGIHQTAFGWNITHLKSGWATFISGTQEGAEMIAEHLIENYTAEFERLTIKDCLVENFKSLAERIETDAKLWNLRRLYVVPQRQLDRQGKEMQPKMQIVS